MQEQLSALEAQLLEKEQLVLALTERLEQAAEQLDRIHRSGGDRGLRHAAGIPPELIEGQRTLVESLTQAVDKWEEMQAAEALERIEANIEELKEMIGGHGVAARSSPFDANPDATEPAPREAARPAVAASGPTVVHGSYDAIKNALLASQTDEPKDSAQTNASEPETDHVPPVDPPEPIDFATAGVDDLKQAVDSRDKYASYLVHRLRVLEMARVAPVDWAALQNAPSELVEKLQSVQSRLDEVLRLAEVEQSLERARVGREAARLRLAEQQLERRMNQAAALGPRAGDDDASDDDETASKGSRWFRMLGIGKADDVSNG
jgi:hypothetical protein